MYLIEKITDKNGKIRTDDRYPNRIGSIATFQIKPFIGYNMVFRYVKEDAYGNIAEDNITITSIVEKIEDGYEYLIVYTNNSIYYFKKYNNQD